MPKVRFEMDGLDDLVRKLDSLTGNDRIERQALEVTADYLVGRMKNITPTLSTKLRNSITRSSVENGEVFVGPAKNVVDWRAHFVEFGTSQKSARPFMRPAFESSKIELQRILAAELKRGMNI